MSFTETVTVLRFTRGRHGDPIAPAAEHDIDGVIIAPRTGTEDDSQGETIIVGLTIYAPFDSDLLATDQVVITNPAWSGTYDVVGEPGRWQNPFTGGQPGLEVALVRVGDHPTGS